MYDDMELLELEDYEDFEDYEDYEDAEDFESFENYEDFEDYEDHEDFEDFEGDPFLGNIFKAVAKVARRVPWRDVIRTGANVISNLESEDEAFNDMAYMAELAAETESEAEADQFLGAIAGLASSLLPTLLSESDYEDYEDFEDYEDYEDYEDHEDFEDFEGDQFLGSILPIARKLLPKAMPFIKRGIQAIGRAMREADPSKQAVKTLPIIATKTVKSLAKQAKAGKPITKKRIQTTLVRQTKKTLSNPRQVAKAVKINRTAAKKAVKKAKAKRVLTKKMIRRSRLLVAR